MSLGPGRRSEAKSLPISLRRPRAVLVIAALLIAVLATLGRGVDEKLRPSSLSIPGTESGRTGEMLQKHFGETAPFAILLQGPPGEIDEQGPALVRTLREEPGVSTVSPWDRGSVDRLRPGPRKALILVDFHVSAEQAVRDTVPLLERTLEQTISPPVRASQTGFASLSRAIQEESIDSTKRAELIALPFLLIVLLLVFRSPVAAAIPLAFGAITVITSRGVLSIAAEWIAIDGFALTVCTMMGLALGVDYALLMVSRFREELAAGAPPLEAARMTRRTAGRTTAFAGSTLFLAMLVTLFVMPGTLLISLAGTAIVVTGISVVVAALVGPALLVVLGHNVDRWRLGRERTDGGGVMTLVRTALSRPLLATAVIGIVVLALAAPVLALKTGPPSAEQLPESNPARAEAELIADAIGPGWDAPFVLLAVSEEGPITAPGKLAALSRWQAKIAEDAGVQAVIGPAQVKTRTAPLRESGNDLLAGRGELNPKRLGRLGRQLGRATGGVRQLREGIDKASAGAGLLAEGSGRAGDGAGQLEEGIARVAEGAERAVGALDRVARGSDQLAFGQSQVELSALRLKLNVESLQPFLERSASQSRELSRDLETRSTADPSLAPEAEEARQLADNLAIVEAQLRDIGALANSLHGDETRLTKGSRRLADGTERLAEAAGELPRGLDRLEGGAAQLAGGLERLRGGADELEAGLTEGFQRSQPLQRGLRRANVGVTVSAGKAESDVNRLRRSSPGLFDSGYFVLSALQGAPGEQRERAGRVVDLEQGGQAAQMVVIPRYTFNTPGSIALNERLKNDADALALASDTTTGVTGGAAELIDYTDTITERIPIVIGVITIATFLILVVILRALLVAAIAVVLNLITVAVAFGVLTLLFDLPADWPLGGNSYVDAIGAAGIFGIVFGLSIDYAVFLLMRMREHYENNSSHREAIEFGLEKTARVITGAAAIMMAVFIAFAGADIATVSQLGTGLAVAVLLDATVIRIVLLPALMLLFGERVWWLPRPLEKLLPEIDLHGSRAG